MRGNTQREHGVRAPGSIDQINKAEPVDIEKEVQAAKTRKQETLKFTKDYQENIDSFLSTSNYSEDIKKEMHNLLSQEIIKAEVITRIEQMPDGKNKLKTILEQIADNKDTIVSQIKERQTQLKSLKGKKGYWLSQLSKITGANGELATKEKQIKDRIKQLEKQEQKLAKARLDLKIPLLPGTAISYTEIKTARPNPESDDELDINAEPYDQTPTPGSFARKGEVPPIHEIAENDLEELPESAVDLSGQEATRRYKPLEVPRVQYDTNPAQTDKLERRANVAGTELEVKMVGDTYVIEFPQNKMNLEIGADRETAEALFNFAVHEAGLVKDQAGLDYLIDKVSLLALREKNLKEQREQMEHEESSPRWRPEQANATDPGAYPEKEMYGENSYTLHDPLNPYRQSVEAKGDGIEYTVGWATADHYYQIYFPQIHAPSEEMSQEGISDQIINISRDPEQAKKVFDFTKGLLKTEKDVIKLFKKVQKFSESLPETEDESLLEQDENQRARQMDVVTQDMLTPKPSRYADGMPGFGEFIMTGKKPEKKVMSVEERAMQIMDEHAEKREPSSYLDAMAQAEAEMRGNESELPDAEVIPRVTIDRRSPSAAANQTIDVMAEPTFAQPPRSETEWWNQEGVEQFTTAWNAIDRQMGSGSAEATMISAGVPKSILKKYPTPQALYDFVENPGFWAKYNGNAAATRDAISDMIEKVFSSDIGPDSTEPSLAQQSRVNRVSGKETAGGVGQGVTIPDIHIPFSRGVEDLPIEDQQRVELAGRPEPIPESRQLVSETAIIPRMGEQTVRMDAAPVAEWWSQEGEGQFTGAFHAIDQAMGSGAAESTLISLGAPEKILKKYNTPTALYQFAEKPGFWASLNGDADATAEAINKLIESAFSTKDSLTITGKQAEAIKNRTGRSDSNDRPRGLV